MYFQSITYYEISTIQSATIKCMFGYDYIELFNDFE